MARRGTPNITVRMDPDLWDDLGRITDDRSELLRAFIRWYLRTPGAKLPTRPSPESAKAIKPEG